MNFVFENKIKQFYLLKVAAAASVPLVVTLIKAFCTTLVT